MPRAPRTAPVRRTRTTRSTATRRPTVSIPVPQAQGPTDRVPTDEAFLRELGLSVGEPSYNQQQAEAILESRRLINEADLSAYANLEAETRHFPINIETIGSLNELEELASNVRFEPANTDAMVDIPAPEPVQGSPFQRRGMAECTVDDHESLTKFKLYRIEELSDNTDDFLIQDDTGNAAFYPSTYFRAIDHGPFRLEDQVKVINVDGVVDLETKKPFSRDYIGGSVTVVEIKDDMVLCHYGPTRGWFKSTQVKMAKRNKYLDPNPFKKGDLVKAIKNDKYSHISIGEVYTVTKAQGDYVQLYEKRDNHYFHTCFSKYVRKVKKKLKKPKFNLGDHIRRLVNMECYDKIDNTLIHAELKAGKLIGDDITVEDISRFTKEMFSW